MANGVDDPTINIYFFHSLSDYFWNIDVFYFLICYVWKYSLCLMIRNYFWSCYKVRFILTPLKLILCECFHCYSSEISEINYTKLCYFCRQIKSIIIFNEWIENLEVLHEFIGWRKVPGSPYSSIIFSALRCKCIDSISILKSVPTTDYFIIWLPTASFVSLIRSDSDLVVLEDECVRRKFVYFWKDLTKPLVYRSHLEQY